MADMAGDQVLVSIVILGAAVLVGTVVYQFIRRGRL